MTNTSGALIQRYDYSPYGQTSQTTTGISNPYQYTGREHDVSGLYYYRARYYHPTLGRFISEDPIGLAAGINSYVYVNGNPLGYIDPLGLQNSQPGITATETGGYTVNWRYYVNRTLEALCFSGAYIVGSGDFGSQYAKQWSATHVVGGGHNGWIGQDKYFHCMANCQAAQKGMGGSAAAQCISDGREWFDQNVKGDKPSDSADDQMANLLGRSSGRENPGGNCSRMCGVYKPGGDFPF